MVGLWRGKRARGASRYLGPALKFSSNTLTLSHVPFGGGFFFVKFVDSRKIPAGDHIVAKFPRATFSPYFPKLC